MAKSTETSVDRTVEPKFLIALVKESSAVKAKTSEISGRFGTRIKNAIEDGHLHRQAFGVVAKMNRMEELKRSDFIRQLYLYVDICQTGGLFGPEHTGNLVDLASRRKDRDEGGGGGDEGGEGGDDEGGEGGPAPLSEAAAAVAAGIKEIKPRGRRKGGGLDNAQAPSGTIIQ